MTKRLLTLLAAVLTLGGCEHTAPGGAYPGVAYPYSDEPPVMIDTDARSYARGGRMRFRLINRTASPMGFNLCRSSFERLNTEGDWRKTTDIAQTCTAELRTLGPGQAAYYEVNADTRDKPGEYRIRTTLHPLGGGQPLEVVSHRFMITRNGD